MTDDNRTFLAASVSDGQPDDPLADVPDGSSPPTHGRPSAPRPVSVADARCALVNSQMRCARATDRQREARGNVAVALERFQRATMQTVTQEQLVRQHIESENRLRADRVAGKIAPRGGQRRLGSAIDAYAFYTKAMRPRRGRRRCLPPWCTTRRGVSDLNALPGSGLPQVKE